MTAADVRRLLEQRAAQGLPERVTDPATLRQVARLVSCAPAVLQGDTTGSTEAAA